MVTYKAYRSAFNYVNSFKVTCMLLWAC